MDWYNHNIYIYVYIIYFLLCRIAHRFYNIYLCLYICTCLCQVLHKLSHDIKVKGRWGHLLLAGCCLRSLQDSIWINVKENCYIKYNIWGASLLLWRVIKYKIYYEKKKRKERIATDLNFAHHELQVAQGVPRNEIRGIRSNKASRS